ncbi:MAG: hypothetical protein OXN81_16760 [Alphaproteobacteria bacterium]|nr:hypothetical protein [Alphaproteobacteria bacterium]
MIEGRVVDVSPTSLSVFVDGSRVELDEARVLRVRQRWDVRVGDPWPWAGPWAGIARLEMPSGLGRDAAVEAVDQAGLAAGFRVCAAPGRSGPR